MPRPFLIALLLLTAAPALAQPASPSGSGFVEGVVWRQPDSLELAVRDLRAMREAGVEAVRTDLVTRATILRMADILGLQVYQDLPVAGLPAARLADTLAFAERELEAALALARDHPSARAFGLARFVDTSDPAACAYVQTLTDRVRSAGLPGAQTYYLSHFLYHDVCSTSVDFVMLDARGHEPLGLVRRWRAAHDGPVGIGSIGAAVDDRSGGHRTPRSPAAQARFLEDGLGDLVALESPPVAVFVYAWRDGVEAPFGLLGPDDAPRPALEVLMGFYTGRQRVFAFDAGPEPAAPENTPTFVIAGWVLALTLALALAFAPRFRQLVPRYFTRHAYYHEALQRGRSAEPWAGFGLAAVVALGAGVIGAVVLWAGAETDVLEALTAGLTLEAEARVLSLIATPLATVLLVGVIYGVWLLLNMLWMLALSGSHRVRPEQALTLAVWSRWPVLVLAVGAVLAVVQPEPIRWVPLLLAGWGLAEIVAAVRMLYDFSRVTRVPMPRALVLGLGVPTALLALGGLLATTAARPELAFLWNLATKQ